MNSPFIQKEPVFMVSELIEAHQQLRLTIYKMAHGCAFKVIQNVFGVSKSLITSTFNLENL